MSAITNPGRQGQAVDFDNFRYGRMMPTDLDAVLDYKGKAWVLIEVKSGKARLSVGQRIALERMADDLSQLRPTILIVARHNVPKDREVDLAKCKVGSYRENGQWEECAPQFAKQFVDEWLEQKGVIV